MQQANNRKELSDLRQHLPIHPQVFSFFLLIHCNSKKQLSSEKNPAIHAMHEKRACLPHVFIAIDQSHQHFAL